MIYTSEADIYKGIDEAGEWIYRTKGGAHLNSRIEFGISGVRPPIYSSESCLESIRGPVGGSDPGGRTPVTKFRLHSNLGDTAEGSGRQGYPSARFARP